MKSTPSKRYGHQGFTLIELILVVAVIGILIGMMLPAVRRTSEAARRTVCANNARQIAFAMHNYESSHLYLPPAVGTFDTSGRWVDGDGQTSAFVALLPYLEDGAFMDDIQDALELSPDEGSVAIVISPEDEDFLPWQNRIPILSCPTNMINSQAVFGQISYAFSIGDVARGITSAPQRGAMTAHSMTYIEDITDGTSSTVLLTEICSTYNSPVSGIVVDNSTDFLNNPSLIDSIYDHEQKKFRKTVQLLDDRRGKSWADGAAASTLMNTIRPPQGGNCVTSEGRFADGLYSASSSHPRITIAAFADASVHHLTNSIDAGDPTAPTLTPQQFDRGSPHGIWGSLGSARASEVIEDF